MLDWRLTWFPDAFDVIGQITWGEPLGFLKEGSDIRGAIQEISNILSYAAVVSIVSYSIPEGLTYPKCADRADAVP